MHRLRCLVLYINGLLAIPALPAQPLASGPVPETPPFAFFEYFGEEAGIDGAVRLFRQDRQGYLWCAVEHKGLLRFDGVAFKAYQNNPDDPASLPDNDIRDILEDRDGRLWFAAQTGVIRYDPARQQFAYIPAPRPAGGISLMEDRGGRIWAGMVDGLAYYDPRLDSLVYCLGAGIRNGYTGAYFAKSSFDRFFALAEDMDGKLWAGATMYEVKGPGVTAVLAIDPSRKEVVYYPPDAGLKVPSRWQENGASSFLFDSKKRMIRMGGEDVGLLQFSVDTRQWRQLLPAARQTTNSTGNTTFALSPQNDSMSWIGTDAGLSLLNTRTGRQGHFSPAPGKAGGYLGGRYYTMYRDRGGILWFGSDSRIGRLAPYHQQFPIHSPLPVDFTAQAIAEYPPTGELFFAAWDNDKFFRVIAWNPRTGKQRRFAQRLTFPPNDARAVHQLFVAPDGRIWVLLNKGVGWLDPGTLRLTLPDLPIANNPVRTTGLWARQITTDQAGNLWLATFGSGIVRYDAATGTFWRPPEFPVLQGARREYNEYLYSVLFDSTGRLFMGENGTGLEIWDPAQNTRSISIPQAKNSHSLSGIFVRCVARDARGHIWLGTENGLCRYLPGLAPDSAFERIKGVSEPVLQIVSDNNGRLWLKTPKSLFCYAPETRTVKKFGEKEGLTIPDQMPLFKGSDGQIWLGDDLHFYPEKINLFPPAAVPLITGFRIYDQPVPLPVASDQNGTSFFPEISLRPSQEVFTIDIGTMGFVAPEETRLLYRLNDNDNWTEAGAQRAFTFNRLPGGRYRFQVKAVAPDGSHTGRTMVLPLRVVPPFYRAVWFWVLCALVFAAGIYALFRYREYQRLQQEKLRLRIARDLHDEMGSTLSSISILSDAALRLLQHDIDRARFGTIGERTRQVMEAMSDIVWSVNPQNDTMANVLQRMIEFAVELFEPQDIALHFDAGEAVKTLNLPMEQRKDFYLLFKEAVNNAAKYSGAREVWVTVRAENGGLLLEVRDNGRGFDLEAVKRGNGLWNMQRRAERMGGTFELESAPGLGATVRVRV